MAKQSKRIKAINERLDLDRAYPVDEALEVLQSCPAAKFDESVEIAINLGIDVRKSDQMLRGSTVLPKGTGRSIRVAVFAQGDDEAVAKEAGADKVGFESLVEEMQAGKIDYDIIIATPDAMPMVSKLGKLLGPHGLMPNPKTGTVTVNVEQAVRDAKSGQIQYRSDKNGIIHCIVGKRSFNVADLRENIVSLLEVLKKAKPSAAKGVYLKKVSLSTTMGPGVKVDLA